MSDAKTGYIYWYIQCLIATNSQFLDVQVHSVFPRLLYQGSEPLLGIYDTLPDSYELPADGGLPILMLVPPLFVLLYLIHARLGATCEMSSQVGIF